MQKLIKFADSYHADIADDLGHGRNYRSKETKVREPHNAENRSWTSCLRAPSAADLHLTDLGLYSNEGRRPWN